MDGVATVLQQLACFTCVARAATAGSRLVDGDPQPRECETATERHVGAFKGRVVGGRWANPYAGELAKNTRL